MFVIGVFGGIASGKTVLMKAMKKHGYYCIDCDEVIDWLLQHPESEIGESMKAAIVERFGAVYDSDGIIANKVNTQIMADSDADDSFSAIMKRYTRMEVERRICAYKDDGASHIAIDAVQTLWGDGYDWITDRNIRIIAPVISRILRLRRREGIPLREAEQKVHGYDRQDFATTEYVMHYTLYNNEGLAEFSTVCDNFLEDREKDGWRIT